MNTYKLVYRQVLKEEYTIEAKSFEEAVAIADEGDDPADTWILSKNLQSAFRDGLPLPEESY